MAGAHVQGLAEGDVVTARKLISMEPLPRRAKFLDRDQVDRDIRDAIAKLDRKLYDRASGYSVGGYEWGEPEYDVQNHIVIGTLRLERPT